MGGKGRPPPRGTKRPEQGFFVLDGAAYGVLDDQSFVVDDEAANKPGVHESPTRVNKAPVHERRPSAEATPERQLPVPEGDGRPVGRGVAAEAPGACDYLDFDVDVSSDPGGARRVPNTTGSRRGCSSTRPTTVLKSDEYEDPR